MKYRLEIKNEAVLQLRTVKNPGASSEALGGEKGPFAVAAVYDRRSLSFVEGKDSDGHRPPLQEGENRSKLRGIRPKRLNKEQRQGIGWRLDALQNDLAGDIKKLTARTQENTIFASDPIASYSDWKATSSTCML